jgi:hypothetical protein
MGETGADTVSTRRKFPDPIVIGARPTPGEIPLNHGVAGGAYGGSKSNPIIITSVIGGPKLNSWNKP